MLPAPAACAIASARRQAFYCTLTITHTQHTPQDSFKPWISDIKAIFKKDLQRNGTRAERCQGAGYMWLRFGKGTNDFMSMTSGLKRPVYLQSTWLRSTEAWQVRGWGGRRLTLAQSAALPAVLLRRRMRAADACGRLIQKLTAQTTHATLTAPPLALRAGVRGHSEHGLLNPC